VELTCTSIRQEQRVAGFPINEPFPDWAGYLRRMRGAGTTRICVNRRDLIDLLRALEDACPDRGEVNQLFIEINENNSGMVLRCLNRDNGQRAIGGLFAYNTKGRWHPTDSWEQGVLDVQVKRPVRRLEVTDG
jgi:hypothetical protein